MENLRGKTISSGLAKLLSQSATFVLRLCYLSILARLLSPSDFGLVAMVTVVTGILDIFTSAGLSSATVQKAEITNQQISCLFWINIAVGAALALICAASASLIATFYHEPGLSGITIAMAPSFLLNAAGVQHSALLQRELRYVTLSAIDTFSQCVGILTGITLALNGYGYWALVVSTLLSPSINTACCWLATGWVPGRPRAEVETWSMLRFGATITLNNLIVYLGYNLEKILLGRFLGAEVLGLYTRAAQLINLPVQSVNSAIGGVFFSALSRLQRDPARVRSFFLKGYSLVMAVMIPTTLYLALFANDIVAVILGPKWSEAAIIFRLMTPSVLVLIIINPLAWLLRSIGMQKRSLYVGFVISPLVIASYALGVPYGPTGVAFSYSAVLTLWLVPHVAWCVHGTPVSIKDLARTIAGPFLSGVVAAICAFEVQRYFGHDLSSVLRLALGGVTMAGVYGCMQLFALGQRGLYLDVLVSLRRSRLGA